MHGLAGAALPLVIAVVVLGSPVAGVAQPKSGWTGLISADTVGRIWEILEDETLHDRKETRRALARLGSAAIPSLCAVLWQNPVAGEMRGSGGSQRPPTDVQRRALIAGIRSHGMPVVRIFLKTICDSTAGEDDRIRAMQLLERIGDATTITLVVDLFATITEAHRQSPSVRGSMHRALVAVLGREPASAKPLSISWRSMTADTRRHVLEALKGAEGRGALAFLQRVLGTDDKSDPAVITLIGTLGARSPANVEEDTLKSLRGRLEQEPGKLCAIVATTLAHLRDLASVPRLVALAEDRDLATARSAKAALQILTGRRSSGSESWEAWYESEIEWLRSEAPDVIWDLHSTKPGAAVSAIHEIGRHAVFSRTLARDLVQALDDDSPWVRRSACEALGKLKDRASLPRLLACMERDEDVRTRHAAWQALRAITARNLPEKATAWARVIATNY